MCNIKGYIREYILREINVRIESDMIGVLYTKMELKADGGGNLRSAFSISPQCGNLLGQRSTIGSPVPYSGHGVDLPEGDVMNADRVFCCGFYSVRPHGENSRRWGRPSEGI